MWATAAVLGLKELQVHDPNNNSHGNADKRYELTLYLLKTETVFQNEHVIPPEGITDKNFGFCISVGFVLLTEKNRMNG